jgi:hypothetical protein
LSGVKPRVQRLGGILERENSISKVYRVWLSYWGMGVGGSRPTKVDCVELEPMSAREPDLDPSEVKLAEVV